MIYSFPRLWSMGTGMGSPDFHHSLLALTRVADEITLLYPRHRGTTLGDQAPPGVRAVGFRDLRLPLIPAPAGPRLGRFVVLCLNWPLRLLNYVLFNLAALLAAQRVTAGAAPDLVTAHGFMGVWTAARIAARSGAPLLVRLFGVSLGMKGFAPAIVAGQFEEALAFKTPAAHWLIADDGSGGSAVAIRMGVRPEKITMLRPAVDRAAGGPPVGSGRSPYRRRLGLAPDTLVVLRTCRLWVQQHVERLLEVLPSATGGGAPVAAVIIGDGPERERLEQLAARLGRKVVFTGPLPNEGLAEHYLAADVYAATGDRTGLGQSVLEAMCYGLPVVAIDAGEASKLIRDRVNGRLVPLDDHPALASALGELLEDGALRQRLGREAMRTAEQEIPDLRERLAAEAEVFARLMNGRAPGS